MIEGFSYAELASAESHALLSSGRRRYWHWKELFRFTRLPTHKDDFKQADFLITYAKEEKGNAVFMDFAVLPNHWLIPDSKTSKTYSIRTTIPKPSGLTDLYYKDATVLIFNRPIKEVAAILSNINERYRKRKLQEMGREFEK